ncbi:MAG TPA: M3 family metallopeptidase [Stellaceae bacterium]|nr:M3 family metallopeptidase [Stellaceae bacterium]
MTDNPLHEDWATPFGLPPFDRIVPAHFPPAFDRGMDEELAEIAAITGSPEPASFANTIEALERRAQLLERVENLFSNLNSSATNKEIDTIARDYVPKLAEHRTKIALDPKLFARIDALYRKRETLGLAPDQLRLLERYHLRFVRAGAALGGQAKARMTEIQTRMAALHVHFGQNVLYDEDDWRLVLDEGDLAGLPDFARDAAAAAAKERGFDGRYVITLSRSSVEPFLTFSARRDLRETAYRAWVQRGEHHGEHDNAPLIAELLALRQEQARLLGYETYAAFRLDDTMAKTPEAAEHLLEQVWTPAKHRAAEERAELAEAANADGLNAPLAPWDWRYYAEKVRAAKYDFDESAVKPYFVLDNMVAALFETAGRLFGLSFVPRSDCPVYHPDVRVYEVRVAGGKAIGLFLHDNFARPGKRSGAWMSSYRDQESLDGEVLPIVVNNNNFSKGDPTLLSFDDAKTLFHEFGHGLHGLLSHVRYRSQSGTSVRRDFVEFPSQIMEHWAEAPETLRKYARHYQTGEKLPKALLNKLLAARNFNQGFATVEYTACAMLDLELHARKDVAPVDIACFERDFLARVGMPAEIGLRHRPTHFLHLFDGAGYAAGYYAYMWAEVLDADGYAAFTERGDVFDAELAAKLKVIYSAGDTRDPMALFREFRGRDPAIDALLAQRGLNQ